jgi:hypothetical protein
MLLTVPLAITVDCVASSVECDIPSGKLKQVTIPVDSGGKGYVSHESHSNAICKLAQV